MSFDRDALIAACRAHGCVTRVVVAGVRGSAPREVGAAMLVWPGGFSGTIGGGALEYDALRTARQMEGPGQRHFARHALGPDLGQCCGGSVDLLFETYDLNAAEAVQGKLVARGKGDMPLAVARLVTTQRHGDTPPCPQRHGDWMIEPVTTRDRPVWIWGAGHVGHAMIKVLEPLPRFQITSVETDTARFPDDLPGTVETIAAAQPERLVRYAPPDATHLIATYSHELDLALCHALLTHGFSFAGLIGSATKWARFRSRLAKLGHQASEINRITCPIGDPSLGKHPQAIALGVATAMLQHEYATAAQKGYA